MHEFKIGDRVEHEGNAPGYVGVITDAISGGNAVWVKWMRSPDSERVSTVFLIPERVAARPKVYLAGPMRGVSQFNFPAFDGAANALMLRGWDVFNPAAHDRKKGFDARGMTGHEDLAAIGFDLRAALADDVAYIATTASAVAVLPGWEKSSGARAEVALAHALGLPVAAWHRFRYNGKLPADRHLIKAETPPSGTIHTVREDAVKVASALETALGALPDAWNEADPMADSHIGSDSGTNVDGEQRIGVSGNTGKVWPNPFRHDKGGWPVKPFSAGKPGPRWPGDGPSIHFETIGKRAPVDALAVAFGNAAAKGEVRTTSSTGGEKGVKPEMYSLLPVEALEKVARHYGIGAAKYAKNQWRKGYEWSKSFDALQRHANAFWRGEDIDEETQSPHMAAVAFHALALLTFMDEHPDHDDRFKRE